MVNVQSVGYTVTYIFLLEEFMNNICNEDIFIFNINTRYYISK